MQPNSSEGPAVHLRSHKCRPTSSRRRDHTGLLEPVRCSLTARLVRVAPKALAAAASAMHGVATTPRIRTGSRASTLVTPGQGPHTARVTYARALTLFAGTAWGLRSASPGAEPSAAPAARADHRRGADDRDRLHSTTDRGTRSAARAAARRRLDRKRAGMAPSTALLVQDGDWARLFSNLYSLTAILSTLAQEVPGRVRAGLAWLSGALNGEPVRLAWPPVGDRNSAENTGAGQRAGGHSRSAGGRTGAAPARAVAVGAGCRWRNETTTGPQQPAERPRQRQRSCSPGSAPRGLLTAIVQEPHIDLPALLRKPANHATSQRHPEATCSAPCSIPRPFWAQQRSPTAARPPAAV